MSSNTDGGTLQRDKAGQENTGYHTYPITTMHGPKDKSCFHGKPEDWKRIGVKRNFRSLK